MYKLLLCWRYLKTRYLAMACIISVMLGVATLIVVNSVMSGFSTKLREKLHALLSDVVIESHGMDGFGNPLGKMARIRQDAFLGPRIEAMATTLEVFALLEYDYPGGETVTRPVRLVGVDPKERGPLGGFQEYLVRTKNNPSFDVPERIREQLQMFHDVQMRLNDHPILNFADGDVPPPPQPPPSPVWIPHGAVVGNLIACIRVKSPDPTKTHEEWYPIKIGDSIKLITMSGLKREEQRKPEPVYGRFVVVDYFKSEMSDYDSNYVFVPLDYLQHLRTMGDRVTSIQIKLKDYDRDGDAVRSALADMFKGEPITVSTWEGKQGAILAAINIEKGILNVLLFLIIAVAGFGILAIFSMIVTEKTRDIGILKALGAPSGGILRIFLSYGLLLGLVGAGMGSFLGILLTDNINTVERWLGQVTGKKLFDPGVYYFTEIPTDIQVGTVILVNVGAVMIAVVFSVIPALRAALLHPVRALRYE